MATLAKMKSNIFHVMLNYRDYILGNFLILHLVTMIATPLSDPCSLCRPSSLRCPVSRNWRRVGRRKNSLQSHRSKLAQTGSDQSALPRRISEEKMIRRSARRSD